MIVPVYVQRPCEPKTKTYVGRASDQCTMEEVAEQVGVPAGCLVDGKLMRRKGEKQWSLVAEVRFGEPK